MNSRESIKKFLNEVHDVSLGYSEITFLRVGELEEGQVGYRVDDKGKSLVTGHDGDWQDGWIVIATDMVGDPIFVDISSPNLPVFSAAHGEGMWEPMIIADSLDKLKQILAILANVSQLRATPVDLEANPISEKEMNTVLAAIHNLIPDLDTFYWDVFLES